MGLGTIPDFEATATCIDPQGCPSSPRRGPYSGNWQELIQTPGWWPGFRPATWMLLKNSSSATAAGYYRTLLGIVGIVQEAQDAIQDTFLKAFRHIGSFEGRSKFSTWLLMIATIRHYNASGSASRLKASMRRITERSFAPGSFGLVGDNPEQLYSEAERRELVERAVMGLPSKYRFVLVLRDIEQALHRGGCSGAQSGNPDLEISALRARLMLRESLAPHFAPAPRGWDCDYLQRVHVGFGRLLGRRSPAEVRRSSKPRRALQNLSGYLRFHS